MRTTAPLLLAALMLANCSNGAPDATPTDPGGGGPPTIASVVVSAPNGGVAVGQTIQLTAVARAADGSALSGVAFTWSSEKPEIATVDSSTGSLTGVAAGSALVSASAGGKSGSAVVTVTAVAPPPPSSAVSGIAYVRGSDIHLIAPDGTGDRVLWSSPAGPPVSQFLVPVSGLAWRSDGTELAFASDHEQAYSWFQHDLYALRADGSQLRRLTNPPARVGLASFPTATVKVTVLNSTLSYATFIVYMMGASKPATVILGPGASQIVTFQVADLGNVAQPIVAMFGEKRWFGDRAPDIQAGTTFDAGFVTITAYSPASGWGAGAPVWRAGGQDVAFILSPYCTIRHVADPSPPGPTMQALVDENAFTGFCAYDRGPTPATANKLLVANRDENVTSIYLVTEAATSPGVPILRLDDYNFIYDIRWLPDASGFLLSMRDGLMEDYANLYEYAFPSGPLRKLTNFRVDDEQMRAFSISPDGTQIVFEWSTTSLVASGPHDLYVMNRDASGQRLLVRDAVSPAWSPISR